MQCQDFLVWSIAFGSIRDSGERVQFYVFSISNYCFGNSP